LVDFIKINNPKSILIKGYTDSDGDDQLNLDLSKNRANSIKELLTNNGVSINIDIIGLGKSNPIAPNDTKENKSKNRRVEIFFKN
jgi:outer membrane protein OmpA-like peptidoglycan-associated protein